MILFIKSLIGAFIVVLVSIVSKTNNYVISGLIPLFPFFGLIAEIFVYKDQGIVGLKKMILFSMFSLIPYFVYLITIFILINKFDFKFIILIAIIMWFICSYAIFYIWHLYF